MKKILLVIISLCLAILVIGCSGSSETNKNEDLIERQTAEIKEQQEKLEEKDEEIKELKRELSVAKSNLMAVEEELDSIVVEKVEPEKEVEEAEPSSIDDIKTEMRDILDELIEKEFGGKLTKFTITDNLDYYEVSYSTRWASEDTVKKEMYEVTLFYVEAGVTNTTLDLTATTDMGRTYNSVTTSEMLTKMINYEMDYNEWLKEAF
jgi:hypothetical protein